MHAKHDDVGYELAMFVLPKALSPSEREGLLKSVERGLRSRADGVVESATLPLDDVPARALSIDMPGGTRGRWLIAFVADDRMIQISTLGPDDDDTRAQSEAFFRSYSMKGSTSPSATK